MGVWVFDPAPAKVDVAITLGTQSDLVPLAIQGCTEKVFAALARVSCRSPRRRRCEDLTSAKTRKIDEGIAKDGFIHQLEP